MPSRQPLRERCAVPTQVCTDRRKLDNYSVQKRGDTTVKSHVKRRLSMFGIDEVPRTPRDPHGPRQFLPYLYLFSPPAPGAPPPPGNWTHTIRLLPPSKTRAVGCTDLVTSPRAGLDLRIPPAALKSDEAGLHITTGHLTLARDFLALALPYYASAHPGAISPGLAGCGWPTSTSTSTSTSTYTSTSGQWSGTATAVDWTPIGHTPLEGLGNMMPQVSPLSQADPVRVLVLGPPRLVLAITLVYIAFASGRSVAEVTRSVLEGDVDPEWCSLIGDDGDLGLGQKGMKVLERAALNDM
ncbi:hypothetical protein C8F04DRAFT_1123946 [Mycena alexandri]|uniref:Uncharacterized protein n=1 Tax=Mycena alexandri TaxID=1745969 RepID=A0AAD6SFT7_9AGAR|nr:hypothetical protein C8F04DRAFT_1123946 [Mycena alexandri]